MSYGNSMILSQSEATAAQRTWTFHLTVTADGSDATGLTLSGADFKISKAGGAFANAVGTVTELANGWYKMVFDAGDVDTLGSLACLVVKATADSLRVAHQVTALDLNVASVAVGSIATEAITALAVKADAVTEIQSGLATAVNVAAVNRKVRDTSHALGTIAGASGNSSGVSARDATKAVVTATGTFGGGTITVQTTADPLASPIVWVDTALTLTADGSVTVTLPVSAIRAKLAGATGASVVVTALLSRPI